jgi:hypothetical protein
MTYAFNIYQKRWDCAFEWALGAGLPIFVAGVLCVYLPLLRPTSISILTLDYIDQGERFQIVQGFGCGNSPAGGALPILLFGSWQVTLPLISIFFYCREHFLAVALTAGLTAQAKIIFIFYHHSRDTNRFLESNGSVSRSTFMRALGLGCVDVLLTLPIGIINIVLETLRCITGANGIFYAGWVFIHTDWEPVALSYAWYFEDGAWSVFDLYWDQWVDPILALVIFGLFGLTPEARATYRRTLYTLCERFGWKIHTREEDDIGEIVFGAQQMTTVELQSGYDDFFSSRRLVLTARSSSTEPGFAVSPAGRGTDEYDIEKGRSNVRKTLEDSCASSELQLEFGSSIAQRKEERISSEIDTESSSGTTNPDRAGSPTNVSSQPCVSFLLFASFKPTNPPFSGARVCMHDNALPLRINSMELARSGAQTYVSIVPPVFVPLSNSTSQRANDGERRKYHGHRSCTRCDCLTVDRDFDKIHASVDGDRLPAHT